MRVLHVVSGFRPYVNNGLITYAEDLMAEQVRAGHNVSCFMPGRHLPLLRGPRLHRRRRGAVHVFEWLNFPAVAGGLRGTPDPERDVADRAAEDVFARVLSEARPDVVHVHDLAGLPSSLLDHLRSAEVPVVMTLHDYLPLCPTVRLYDADRAVCLRTEPGAMCAVCCRDAPLDNADARLRTLDFEGQRARRVVPGLARLLEAPATGRALATLGGRLAASPHRGPAAEIAPEPGRPAPGHAASPASYQRRRDVNLERLARVNALLAPSRRVRDIYAMLGVPRERLRVLPVTAVHLKALHPRRIQPQDRVTFATLTAMSSPDKGAGVVLGALDRLAARGYGDRFDLVVAGGVPDHELPALRRHPAVRLAGKYGSSQLDALLDDVHVGIVPSVWEETFGFVGVEFLAKGIPVIGNAMGGITDYVRDDETGWLNRSSSAEELAAIMARIIERPEQVAALNARVLDLRGELVQPMFDHAARVDAVYAEVTDRS